MFKKDKDLPEKPEVPDVQRECPKCHRKSVLTGVCERCMSLGEVIVVGKDKVEK